jgi:methyl-accepting chemotaxis protein
MQDIIASVNSVTGLMREVSASSAEQSTGIGQVNEAVTQMDEVTQQNAALVEQATRATTGLAQNARTLIQALSLFKLKGQQHGAPASSLATVAKSRGKTMNRAA